MDDIAGFRALVADEVRMMRAAAAGAADLALGDGWLDAVRVRPLPDGGMGSLRLRTPCTPPLESTRACARA